mmetsp:Transcript_7150/g.19923  ORF Transcript_7150/g.19923 Transcript_7150/m.19923 type:complete len:281 (-) Transcript_7150:124-966(-)|eukprot:CAMPEP_0181040108 /NCGR_PEP_ID=MMETSP1070-20121207/10867_1 /TAXON_ID=265543 /ORGANISM="Minutocellus polymorphus, Strain NH13" /LENGTH=280 /DNA_ID=CAMNT_0023118085 /DNA_START=61 /DNA_END=903 /DNA_ORIENTATION=+
MSDETASATSTTGSGSGGSGGGILDQIIDAHEQVYTMVSNVFAGGLSSIAASSSSGDASSSNTGGRSGGMPPANDLPVFEGSPEEMLSAEDLEEMLSTKSPLEGMAEMVMGDIFEGQMGPQTPMEHVAAFRAAIDWTEPLIVGLVVFQVVMFGLTVALIKRGGTATRFGMLVFIAVLVRLAERINAYAGNRWEDIATQNYFDTNGVFVLIFLAVPLLLDCVIMLVSFMREASGLLVEVKTMEMKKKGSSSKQKKKSNDGGVDGAGGSRKGGRGKRSKKEN